MFEKIQHPITGKWHKTSSAIGSQLIKNYSKKLKLTGGAMDLEPGQSIWYYITMIKNELTSLREQLDPHLPHRMQTNPIEWRESPYAAAARLREAPSLGEITRDLRLVRTELRRITPLDGVFSVEMNNQSAALTEALRDINNSIRERAQQLDAAYEERWPSDGSM